MNIAEAVANTETQIVEFHAGNKSNENGADAVFTFMTGREANAFISEIGGRVASKGAGNGMVKLPASQGGGWVDFPARKAYVIADGRRFLIQVPARDGVSPYAPMLRKRH